MASGRAPYRYPDHACKSLAVPARARCDGVDGWNSHKRHRKHKKIFCEFFAFCGYFRTYEQLDYPESSGADGSGCPLRARDCCAARAADIERAGGQGNHKRREPSLMVNRGLSSLRRILRNKRGKEKSSIR
jgi:hypothetical protein